MTVKDYNNGSEPVSGKEKVQEDRFRKTERNTGGLKRFIKPYN